MHRVPVCPASGSAHFGPHVLHLASTLFSYRCLRRPADSTVFNGHHSRQMGHRRIAAKSLETLKQTAWPTGLYRRTARAEGGAEVRAEAPFTNILRLTPRRA